MASKPTQRSLKHLRDAGWTVCIVEKWIPPRGTMKFGVRKDAFGFGDLLACRVTPVKQIALVQTTDHTSFSKHRDKLFSIPELEKWKDSGGTVLLHGWAKRGPRGKRKTWTLREEVL